MIKTFTSSLSRRPKSFGPSPGLLPFSQARFQSTINGVPNISSSSPLNGAPTLNDVPDSSSIDFTQDPTSQEAAIGAVRKIGFLTDLYGIDFGWGTSTMVQHLFEFIQIYVTSDWFFSIVCLSFTVRAIATTLTLRSTDNSAKMQALQPLTKPKVDLVKEYTASGKRMEAQRLSQEVKEIHRRAGVKTSKMLWPFLQIPLSFGCWRLMWNLSDARAPGLDTGGALWFQNLTYCDPLFILPVVTGALQFVSQRVSLNDSYVRVLLLHLTRLRRTALL